MDPRADSPAEGRGSATLRPPNASLEATVARPAPVRRRGSVSEEAAFAFVLRPLLLRVHLEGWDLAAACVQQHMSAVGVGFGASGQGRREDEAQEAAAADDPHNNSRGTGDGTLRPAVIQQRLVQLDASQLRLKIVANELPRAASCAMSWGCRRSNPYDVMTNALQGMRLTKKQRYLASPATTADVGKSDQ